MKLKLSIAFAVLLLVALWAWARPAYIDCPIDGAPMYFERQVGIPGSGHEVCWYSHMAYETGPDGLPQQVRHEAYINCGE